jgi:CxxC motif-containing protein (DUF1111 family)
MFHYNPIGSKGSRTVGMQRLSLSIAFMLATGIAAQAQPKDPGIRGGAPGAGQPIAGLTPGELDYFTNHGAAEFNNVETAADGLGPRFNLDSCGGCHVHPALGGSSPPTNNPQVVRASLMAPGNIVPSFLAPNGPVREVRFKKNPDGTPDGGVHAIFTIAGRTDKPAGCNIAQPNFSDAGNLSFRIPTPTFGAGLIEAITDTTIRNNLSGEQGGRKSQLGIRGHVNTNGNDGTVTRFGWKAQNKSLLIFSGEAYSVEMGVTNENFPNEREEARDCAKTSTPENHAVFNVGNSEPSDLVLFMVFMKFLDQPVPACAGNGCSQSIQNGRRVFQDTGCASCHTPVLPTGSSSSVALTNKQAHLFSDLAVHHMGSDLADGVTQGSAGPDEFRTAPLWGVGQRAFFLHDGRTSDLLHAILAHSSQGSEANRVIDNFQSNLSVSQQQDVLNFLRSL